MSVSAYRGALLGLAVGDALGTTLEFCSPGSFTPLRDMVGGGPFGLRAGEWTDDTAMALCLAESLLELGGFDAVDQLERYIRWWQHGHLASNGRCFDIGTQTRIALSRFERAQSPRAPANADGAEKDGAGNGSLMRLAAVPLAYAANVEAAIDRSARSSRTTHPADRPVDACKYLGALIASAANGISRSELLSESFWQWGNLHPEIEEVARGSFTRKDPPDIAGSGYVVRSLEAALWALARTDSFRDGALLAVNLGEDADTTGAVYGQLAGAIYGEHAIPPVWRAKLARHDLIVEFASRLHQRREMFTHWQGGETVPATLPAQHSGGGRARRRVVHPLRRWASREWRWRAAPVRARCRGVVRRPRQLVPAGRGGTGGPVNFP